MRLTASLAIMILATGCETPPQPRTSAAQFKVEITQEVPAGFAAYVDNIYAKVPVVRIRPEYYPLCITHEIRHIFEGAWHGATPMSCDERWDRERALAASNPVTMQLGLEKTSGAEENFASSAAQAGILNRVYERFIKLFGYPRRPTHTVVD